MNSELHRSSPAIVGRLAPSPTGALHLGNARSFLVAWLAARKRSGNLLLRIEDIDSPRIKPWSVQQTVADLTWLGMDWDEQHPPQSTRLARYREIFDRLQQAGQVYSCRCTRSDILEAASAPHPVAELAGTRGKTTPEWVAMEGPVYPGTCRLRSPMESEVTDKCAWRWKLDTEEMRWHDLLYGEQCANPHRDLGDFVVAKLTDGQFVPSYQLAVVVDDHDQAVSEVVRGNDLIASTYRQLDIMSFLGWRPPTYAHLPLIIGTDGRRLAKRHGDTRLITLREQERVTPQAVVGYLAHSLGIIATLEPLSTQELLSIDWDWPDLPASNTVFDLKRDLPKLKRLR